MKWNSKEELLEYARKLEGTSVRDANGIHENIGDFVMERKPIYGSAYLGKGGYGEFVEENYFGKVNDSFSKADFSEVGVELKVVPLKVLNNGAVKVKERIVLNKFRYIDIVNENFETSHFIQKNAVLLLIFYFHDNTVEFEDKIVDLVDLWEVLRHDINQIRADWEYIVSKVREGKAHEISEGDTLYLGACTKGATAATSMQKQPYSDIMAPGRALCFKISYANMIYKLLLQDKEKRYDLAPHSIYEGNNSWVPLGIRIHQLVDKYVGMTGRDIFKSFNREYNENNKGRYANISRYMLGFSSKINQYYEFAAADIQVKSIRIELNDTVKESMSFKNIPYVEILDQEWEDSDFYEELTSKFIFMIFKKCEDSDDCFFKGFLLWNMPSKDLSEAQKVWEKAKKCVLYDEFYNMPKQEESSVAHVRPKARNSEDKMPLRDGTMREKKCFWLNNSYIREILRKNHFIS